MPKAPTFDTLHAIKMLVIFKFGVGSLDWSREPVQCGLSE